MSALQVAKAASRISQVLQWPVSEVTSITPASDPRFRTAGRRALELSVHRIRASSWFGVLVRRLRSNAS